MNNKSTLFLSFLLLTTISLFSAKKDYSHLLYLTHTSPNTTPNESPATPAGQQEGLHGFKNTGSKPIIPIISVSTTGGGAATIDFSSEFTPIPLGRQAINVKGKNGKNSVVVCDVFLTRDEDPVRYDQEYSKLTPEQKNFLKNVHDEELKKKNIKQENIKKDTFQVPKSTQQQTISQSNNKQASQIKTPDIKNISPRINNQNLNNTSIITNSTTNTQEQPILKTGPIFNAQKHLTQDMIAETLKKTLTLKNFNPQGFFKNLTPKDFHEGESQEKGKFVVIACQKHGDQIGFVKIFFEEMDGLFMKKDSGVLITDKPLKPNFFDHSPPQETPKAETSKPEAPKKETSKTEAPKVETPKTEIPKTETLKKKNNRGRAVRGFYFGQNSEEDGFSKLFPGFRLNKRNAPPAQSSNRSFKKKDNQNNSTTTINSNSKIKISKKDINVKSGIQQGENPLDKNQLKNPLTTQQPQNKNQSPKEQVKQQKLNDIQDQKRKIQQKEPNKSINRKNSNIKRVFRKRPPPTNHAQQPVPGKTETKPSVVSTKEGQKIPTSGLVHETNPSVQNIPTLTPQQAYYANKITKDVGDFLEKVPAINAEWNQLGNKVGMTLFEFAHWIGKKPEEQPQQSDDKQKFSKLYEMPGVEEKLLKYQEKENEKKEQLLKEQKEKEQKEQQEKNKKVQKQILKNQQPNEILQKIKNKYASAFNLFSKSQSQQNQEPPTVKPEEQQESNKRKREEDNDLNEKQKKKCTEKSKNGNNQSSSQDFHKKESSTNNKSKNIDNSKRIKVLEESIKNPSLIMDYNSTLDDYTLKNNPHAQDFVKGQGTPLQCVLHEELCKTLTATSQIAQQNPNNPQIQTLTPAIYEFANAALKNTNPAIACHLTNICHHMADATQGLEKLTKDTGLGAVEGVAEGIQDNIRFCENLALHPAETLKKEYIEPLAQASKELAQAFILSEKLGIAADDTLLHFGAFDIDENTQKSFNDFTQKYVDAVDKFREFYNNTSPKDKVKTFFRIFTGSGIKSALKKGSKNLLFKAFKGEVEAFKTFSKFASEKNLNPEIFKPFNTLTRDAIEKAQQNKPLFKKLEKEVAGRFNNIAKDLPDKLRKGENGILDKMEKAGGHTIEKHVGMMNQDLIKRANDAEESLEAASTFINKSTATDAVNENLRKNADKIAEWVKNRGINDIVSKNKNKKVFEIVHKFPVGQCVFKDKKTVVYNLTKSKIILVPDPTSELGFRMITSYPIDK